VYSCCPDAVAVRQPHTTHLLLGFIGAAAGHWNAVANSAEFCTNSNGTTIAFCHCTNPTPFGGKLIPPMVDCGSNSVDAVGCAQVSCPVGTIQTLQNMADNRIGECCNTFTCIDPTEHTMDNCYPSIPQRLSVRSTCDGGKSFFCSCTGNTFFIPPGSCTVNESETLSVFSKLVGYPCDTAYGAGSISCNTTSELRTLLFPADPDNGICCDTYACVPKPVIEDSPTESPSTPGPETILAQEELIEKLKSNTGYVAAIAGASVMVIIIIILVVIIVKRKRREVQELV